MRLGWIYIAGRLRRWLAAQQFRKGIADFRQKFIQGYG